MQNAGENLGLTTGGKHTGSGVMSLDCEERLRPLGDEVPFSDGENSSEPPLLHPSV